MPFMGLRLIYFAALLISCGYAARFGGKTERVGAAIMLLGSLLSVPATWLTGAGDWLTADVNVLIVDVAALAGLLTLALRTNRYWPLWAAGFHLDAVVTHCAKLLAPAIVPQAYSLSQGLWAYPMLAALVIGTRQHQLRRRRTGPATTAPATPS